jgi:hypothetical protein
LSDATRPARDWLPDIALACFSILTFLLLTEGQVRLFGPDLDVAGLEVRHGGNPLLASFTSAHFVRDPDLMWAPHGSYPRSTRRATGAARGAAEAPRRAAHPRRG